MSSTDQPVLGATTPILKDVEQLKANLKEEKRARTEPSSKDEPAEPEKPCADALDGPAPLDSERRKRRKVGDEESEGEILDGPLPILESSGAEGKEEAVLNAAKSHPVSTDDQPSSSPIKPAVAPSKGPVDDAAQGAEEATTGEPASIPETVQIPEIVNEKVPQATGDELVSLKEQAAPLLESSTEANTDPIAPESVPEAAPKAVLA